MQIFTAGSEVTEDAIKTAITRYSYFINDYKPDKDALFLSYHLTTDGLNHHIVEIDKDEIDSNDIGTLLEEALHDIISKVPEDKVDEALYVLMGAIPHEELDTDLEGCEEYIDIDLGYILPGLIDVTFMVKY